MTKAIGMKGRGQGMARIPSHKALRDRINNELALAIENASLPARLIAGLKNEIRAVQQ